MNMDYATSKAWNYEDLTEAEFIIWGYDVNCQYQPHHKERVEASEHLSFPVGLEDKIYYAIGTWHVHGHKNECYPRYATSFIKGAGVKSAEILEARWSELNHAAPSLRYMTLAHRAEMLDALMNDMNWKTMVNLRKLPMFLYRRLFTNFHPASYISKSYEKALDERDNAEEEFDKLDSTTSDKQRSKWEAQEEQAHATRLHNVKAMDIYLSKLKGGKF